MSAKNMPPSIDRIVKEVCFEDLYSQISQRMTRNPYLLNFRPNHSDIDEVRLSYVELIQVKNANIQENHVSFDAVVKCDMDVDIVERGYDVRRRSNSMTQWLKVRCELALSEEGDNFNFAVERIEDYSKDRNTSKATVSLVPVVYKKDLDKEATDFLQKHCPEALTTPMAVSIKDIAKNRMGLKVLTYRLTEDFSVFGQMCFQKGFAQIYDKDEDEYRAQEVEAGTMIIDPDTFYQRNLGCLNNTIAHECVHWERHRCYHFVLGILDGATTIACRCPVEGQDELKHRDWTDEQWMEWQANAIAPRILLPREPFIAKADELSKSAKRLRFLNNRELVDWIVKELASFFRVSKISAGIRIKEVGWHFAV